MFCFQLKHKQSEKDIYDAAFPLQSAPTFVCTNEEKALYAKLEYASLQQCGSVDVGHMTHVWNSHVLHRLGTDGKPTGNVFYKSEVALKGYELALQKQREDDNRKQRFGGGATAYQQYQAPMLQPDTSGKMSSAQSSGASAVGGREQVGAFAHAGPHLLHGVVPEPTMPMYGMMLPPPSTFSGAVHVPPQSTPYVVPYYGPTAPAQAVLNRPQIRAERQPKTHRTHQCLSCKVPMKGHKCPGKKSD